MNFVRSTVEHLKRIEPIRRIGSATYRALYRIRVTTLVGRVLRRTKSFILYVPKYGYLISAFIQPIQNTAAMNYPNKIVRGVVHRMWFGYRFLHPAVTNAGGQFDAWNEGYDDEITLKNCIAPFQNHTMVSYPGFLSLVNLVKHCEISKIDGALVETGTWKGGCSGAMAMAAKTFGDGTRHVWLFDSFSGLPELRGDKDFDGSFEHAMRVHEDKNGQTGELTPIGALEANIKDAEEVMFKIAQYDRDKTHIVKGWFQDTLPKNVDSIGPIAVLRLDGDLYDSYIVCLETLWDKVVDGGFIVIDDWSLGGCRLAVKDFFASIDHPVPYLHHVDFSVKIIQK